jgi:hypothetical protein
MENHFFHGMNDETKPAAKSLADVPTSPEMLAAFAKAEAAKTVIALVVEEVPETDDLLEILLGGNKHDRPKRNWDPEAGDPPEDKRL